MSTIGCRRVARGPRCRARIDRRVLALALVAAAPTTGSVAIAQDAARVQAPASASRCVVRHQPFMEAGVAHGTMQVVNDGRPCGFTFQFGAKFDPDTWKVDAAPRHGRLQFDGGRVDYLPEAGYAGADAFTVTAFGSNPMMRGTMRRRNGQFAFDVTVGAPAQ